MKKEGIRYVLGSILTIVVIFVIAFLTKEEVKEPEPVVLTDAEKFAEEYTKVTEDNVLPAPATAKLCKNKSLVLANAIAILFVKPLTRSTFDWILSMSSTSNAMNLFWSTTSSVIVPCGSSKVMSAFVSPQVKESIVTVSVFLLFRHNYF